MRKIKSWTNFNEDATATGSSTAGAGAVSSATVGGLPGVAATSGSGDLGFPLYDKGKKTRTKKGNPSQVSDMRFLASAKGVTKVKESIEWSEFSKEDSETIKDSLQELFDNGFKLTMLKHDLDTETFDRTEDETASFQEEEIRISVHKMVQEKWYGNISIRCRFDKSEMTKKVMTLRGRGSDLTEEESKLVDEMDDICHQLINELNYKEGVCNIEWLIAGSGIGDEPRNINLNISITLNRHIYE